MAITREYIKLHDVNADDILKKESGYCPISIKEEMNPPTINYFDTVTNSQLFLSAKNQTHLIQYIISQNIKNQTGNDLTQLEKLIPIMMKEWVAIQNLDDFEYLFDNNLLTLAFINNKFLVNNGCVFQREKNTNVFHTKALVTDPCGNSTMKKYNEMTADDYKTIDVWKPQQLYTYDKRNRYGNNFEAWRKHALIRHLDRSNDGLHDAIPERASLNNQLHGYDMSNIKKGSTFYKNYFYENL